MFWIIFLLLSMGYGFGVMVYLRWLSQTQPSMFHRPLESPVVVLDEPLGHAVAAFKSAVSEPPAAVGTAIRAAVGFSNPIEEYLDSPMETRYLDSDPVPYSPYSDMDSGSSSYSAADSYSVHDSIPSASATPTTSVESGLDEFPDDVLQYFDRDTDRDMDNNRNNDDFSVGISGTQETQERGGEDDEKSDDSAINVEIATYSIADVPEEWRKTMAATSVSNSIFRNDDINGSTAESGGSNVLLGDVPPEMSFSNSTLLPPRKGKKVTADHQ